MTRIKCVFGDLYFSNTNKMFNNQKHNRSAPLSSRVHINSNKE